MMIHINKILCFSLIVCACIAFVGAPQQGFAKPKADPATEAGLSPHKALYSIRLMSSRSAAQLINVSGQMFYEWKPDCDAWIANHSFNLLYEYADSPATKITSDFSQYESFDGDDLNFSSKRKRNGVLFEEYRGHAELKETGIGEAHFNVPKDVHYDLPKGTLFPMAHTINVIQQIKDGKPFHQDTIFDGSDADGPVNVNVFIGKEVSGMAKVEPSADLDTSLLNVPARKVRLAFFPLKDDSEIADYEMDMVFHDNGIVSHMVVEYEDFTVEQKLIALEKRTSQCSAH